MAVLPSASSAVTRTAGLMVPLAVAVVGCAVNTSWVAGPGVIANAALVAPDKVPALVKNVKPVPLLSTLKLENVATPATAATFVAPDRVPPAGFVVTATVTSLVNSIAVLPNASRAVTSTSGVIPAPALAVLGCTVKTS